MGKTALFPFPNKFYHKTAAARPVKFAKVNALPHAQRQFTRLHRDCHAAANKAGLKKLLEERKAAANKQAAPAEEVVAPPKEVVTGAIAGIEIMDLEDAVNVLWKNKIYAESGMGCTGPVVLVSDANLEKSIALLKEAGYVQ